jgi:hypothetical protein
VQVQAKLAREHFVRNIQAVRDAPLLEQREINFVRITAKHVPAHLDVAIGRDV